jgi:hypothetical protein
MTKENGMPSEDANVPSEGFLQALPASERKRLGRAGITRAEAQEKFNRGEEYKLQNLIRNWLLLKGLYFEWDPMHRRTSGKKGRPDFRICVSGLWLAIECKASGETLNEEQAREANRLQASGGKFVVVYSLKRPSRPSTICEPNHLNLTHYDIS